MKVSEELKYKPYKEKIALVGKYNMPIFKILSDYFNILKGNKKLQKEHNVKIIGFVLNGYFIDNIDLYSNFGLGTVIIEIEKLVLYMDFDIYRENVDIIHKLSISSDKPTDITNEYMFKHIFAKAIQLSDLKGKFLIMEADTITWTKSDLEYRTFEDICLPDSIIEDLLLFVKTNEISNLIMRYLMVGAPGCAKTESTLVLANELQKQGVTIIKTPVCERLKGKLELASLLAPALLILDDIDLSLGSRSNGGFKPHTLQLFLDMLDGTQKISNNVGILATTNSPRLTDLAAQRPGRFDKTLCFDELTKDNVKNIIIKSLKYESDLKKDDKIVEIFTNHAVVKMLYEKQVTGAAIYNNVKMLHRRAITLKINITTDWIIAEIEKELRMMEKIRKSDFLTDKMSKGDNAKIGFNYSDDMDLVDESRASKITEVATGYPQKLYR